MVLSRKRKPAPSDACLACFSSLRGFPGLATHRACLLLTFTKAALTSSQRLSKGMSRPEMEQEGQVGTRDRVGKGREETQIKTVQGVVRREEGRRKLCAPGSPAPKFDGGRPWGSVPNGHWLIPCLLPRAAHPNLPLSFGFSSAVRSLLHCHSPYSSQGSSNMSLQILPLPQTAWPLAS